VAKKVYGITEIARKNKVSRSWVWTLYSVKETLIPDFMNGKHPQWIECPVIKKERKHGKK
jgi:hypothetical protein